MLRNPSYMNMTAPWPQQEQQASSHEDFVFFLLAVVKHGIPAELCAADSRGSEPHLL